MLQFVADLMYSELRQQEIEHQRRSASELGLLRTVTVTSPFQRGLVVLANQKGNAKCSHTLLSLSVVQAKGRRDDMQYSAAYARAIRK